MFNKNKTEEQAVSDSANIKQEESTTTDYKWKIEWINVITLVPLHIVAFYGLLCLPAVKYWTLLWAFIVGTASLFGITAGTHRLWSHRTYKAKWPLRLLLMIFQTIAFQHTIYKWLRDHRTHHKFTDTNADPYNACRGLFFSHIGWLLIHKHSDVIKKGATLDHSDLERDIFVVFQRKYYFYLILILSFIFPTMIPWWAWDESLSFSLYIAVIRHCIILHLVFMVNSVAHKWGMRPYDKSITPVENNIVAMMTFGEGWHNYHHVFPWDYKTSEFGNYRINITTVFIDFFAYLGLAYDLQTAHPDLINKCFLRNSNTINYDKLNQ